MLGRIPWSTKVTVGVKKATTLNGETENAPYSVRRRAIVVFVLNSSPGDCLWLPTSQTMPIALGACVVCRSMLFHSEGKKIIVFQGDREANPMLPMEKIWRVASVFTCRLNSPHAKTAQKFRGLIYPRAIHTFMEFPAAAIDSAPVFMRVAWINKYHPAALVIRGRFCCTQKVRAGVRRSEVFDWSPDAKFNHGAAPRSALLWSALFIQFMGVSCKWTAVNF